MYTGRPIGANNFFDLNACTQEGLLEQITSLS